MAGKSLWKAPKSSSLSAATVVGATWLELWGAELPERPASWSAKLGKLDSKSAGEVTADPEESPAKKSASPPRMACSRAKKSAVGSSDPKSVFLLEEVGASKEKSSMVSGVVGIWGRTRRERKSRRGQR